jgi:hypothetical protein
MGWQTDVGAVGNDYALSGTFLWCGIIAGEPFVRQVDLNTFAETADHAQANQLTRRLPLGKLLGSAMLIWSIASLIACSSANNPLT